MHRLLLSLLAFCLCFSAAAECSASITGTWRFKNDQIEIVTQFLPDGTFRQVNASAKGRETYTGRYHLTGQTLWSSPGKLSSRSRSNAFSPMPTRSSRPILPAKPCSGSACGQPPVRKNHPSLRAPQPGVPAAGKRPTLLMQRTWEPNEKAFTFLVPKGWNFKGGIFNVNPLTQNGPGNSIAPKCDLAVKKDEGGTVMIRFAPPWNYADLTYSPTGASLFKPGQYYQGMLVKLLPTPRQFLTEMFQTTRPQATQVTVIAEDPMREMVEAIYRSNQQLNQQLQQMGIKPNRYEGLAMLVEYSEGGQRFREVLKTVITDSRPGAFMWTNEQTIQFRAPASEFEAWKPALDVIYNSIELNPQWIAAVTRAMDQRAKMALETQRYINKVANEIVENRRRTHAEIRYENYLFLCGQDEYVNPFTKKVELDTSAYRHRWMNNQGEILYTDENSHNPNEYEKRPNFEWKQTPARPR